MKLLLTLMAMISLAATSLADVRSDVVDWLKTQGLNISEGYHLSVLVPEDVQKDDIVGFDVEDHVQYGWVKGVDGDTVLIGVPVGSSMSIMLAKKKSELKSVLRSVEGKEAFLGPLHPFAVTGPFHPFQA